MTGSGDGFFASPPPATQAPPPAPPRPSCRRVSQRESSPSPQPPWPARTLCHEHSYHKSRALGSIGTSPRIICYEPAVMVTPVGIVVNRVAAMPIKLREIAMSDMAWVTGVAQTARGAVMPHCDAHRPTTTSTSAESDIHIGQQRHRYRPMRMDIHNHHAAKRGSKIQQQCRE